MKFLVAAVSVAGKMFSPHKESPSCMAEELCVYLFLEQAATYLEQRGTTPAGG